MGNYIFFFLIKKGAGATFAYIINRRLKNESHHLSKAILLSPAGIHKVSINE